MRSNDKQPERLQTLLAKHIQSRAFPGCVLFWGQAESEPQILAAGHHTYACKRPVRRDDLFDLASLTKVLSTTSLVMHYIARGVLTLDEPIGKKLPEFLEGETARQQVTVRHLLSHCAGFPAGIQYYLQDFRDRDDLRHRILRCPLANPPGTLSLYSDIGFLILGFLVETCGNAPQDLLAAKHIFAPLEMTETGYCPDQGLHPRCLPTEIGANGLPYQGVVHDENARALDGVAGHAGVFSTASDLARFAQAWLRDQAPFCLDKSLFETFRQPNSLLPDGDRALGWQLPSQPSSGGAHLSPDAIGHTGFTGTSLWIDRGKNLFVGLLSNAVHPRREAKTEHGFFLKRRQIHTAVYDLLSS